MPVRINCPGCQASLSMPESMYGKAVRCPKCQTPFQCPSGPAPSRPAPAPVRRAPSPPPASSADPFTFEEAAAPAYAPEGDGEPDYSRRGRGHRRLGGWDLVLSGFLFLYISAGCFVACFLLLYFAPNLIGSPPSLTTLKMVVVLGCLLFVGGTVTGALGQSKCMAVPATSGAKGAASASVVFMVIAAIASFLTSGIILAIVLAQNADAVQFLPIFALTAIGSLTGAFVLFLFFLTIAAVSLQQKMLVSNIMAYVVVMAVSPAAFAGLKYIQTMALVERGAPPVMRGKKETDIWDYLPLVIMGVAAGWFVVLLIGLSSAVERARRRGNL